MLKLYVKWQNFLANQRGQSMTEYILILALVAVVTIVVWKGLGDEIMNKINAVVNNLKQ